MSSYPEQSSKSARAAGPLRSEYADDPEMAELVAYFLDELQQRMDRITQAWQSSSRDDLRVLAHQIKGAAGGYGFPTLTQSADSLEQALMANETEIASLKEKVEDLLALCRRAAAGA